MKFIKYLTMATLIGCAQSIMAGTITLENHSPEPISIKFKIAYKIPGQATTLEPTITTLSIPAQGKNDVTTPGTIDEKIGIIITAMKGSHSPWYTIPSTLNQFDKQPGCWAATEGAYTSETLVFNQTADSKNQSIYCQPTRQ